MDIFTVPGGPVPPAAAPGNPDCVGVLDSEGMLEPLRALGDLAYQALSDQREEETPSWCSATMKGSYPFILRKGSNNLDTRWLHIH